MPPRLSVLSRSTFWKTSTKIRISTRSAPRPGSTVGVNIGHSKAWIKDPMKPLHDSELGGDHRVRNRVAPQFGFRTRSNDHCFRHLRNPNAACTVLKESICTVPRVTPAVDNLHVARSAASEPKRASGRHHGAEQTQTSGSPGGAQRSGRALCGRWYPQTCGLSDGPDPARAERRVSSLGKVRLEAAHLLQIPLPTQAPSRHVPENRANRLSPLLKPA